MCAYARACTTHHHAKDDSWDKAEETWQPTQHCKYQSDHDAGHKGILGESNRGVRSPHDRPGHHCGWTGLSQSLSWLGKERTVQKMSNSLDIVRASLSKHAVKS